MDDSVKDPLIIVPEQRERNTRVALILDESKTIWAIAGPAIFTRIAIFGTLIVSQAFAGHLGDLELAAISIATSVITGSCYGLFVGMVSAMETLCGQAFGAQQYHMLGLYLQRAWVVIFGAAILLLPIYIYATPILKIFGQSDEIAELTGKVSIWLIPQHFSFVLLLPIQIFLQSQLKNMVIALISGASLVLHILLSWMFVVKFKMGLIGVATTLNLAWWMPTIGLILYATCGGCPLSWTCLSKHALSELWPFFKLSAASSFMICLETLYYRVPVLLLGFLPHSLVAIDSFSICMSISVGEAMIPLGFLVATVVRVANELGAGNGEGAKFAVIVSAINSTIIGIVFCLLIILLRREFALLFTSSAIIIEAVSKLSILLAFSILLNSIQPVFSGVAVGSGWQYYVAYINIGCYYVIGVPFQMMLAWVFKQGVLGIWSGMMCGTAIQMTVLGFIVYRCDWDKAVAHARDRVGTWSPKDLS